MAVIHLLSNHFGIRHLRNRFLLEQYLLARFCNQRLRWDYPALLGLAGRHFLSLRYCCLLLTNILNTIVFLQRTCNFRKYY